MVLITLFGLKIPLDYDKELVEIKKVTAFFDPYFPCAPEDVFCTC